jgi:DNA-binding GntR family transcriptional regulator
VSKLKPIDRSSFEPPYAQVARGIRERITEGEYRAGDRLPSEAELCAMYGVSRMTARRAVTLLSQDGVVYTQNGRGTFVKAPELGAATFDLGSLRRLVDDDATTVKIREARIVAPSPRVCRTLEVGPESPVVAIERVISSAGLPVFYHSEYLVFDPRRPLVEAEYGVTALRDLLANAGASGFKYGRLKLHASSLTETEASHLDEEPGVSAWVIEHLFFDFEDRPVSWGRFVGRADRLDFSTTVGVPAVEKGGGR